MDDFAVRCYVPYTEPKQFWGQRLEMRCNAEQRVLVLDTETRTTPDQMLIQGSAGLWVNRKLIKFYLLYNEQITPKELGTIRAVANETGHELLTRTDFVEKILYPEVYDQGTVLVGFNIPFDISRLGIRFTYSKKKRFRGGFSIKLSDKPWHPSILIKNIDSKRSFIEFAKPSKKKWSQKKERAYLGCFRDLKTMLFALTNESYSLESALESFGLGEKGHKAEYGYITHESVLDNIQHTMKTYQLYLKILELYTLFNLDEPAEKLFSPASLGKAYLSRMGIKTFREANPDFPPKILGYAMASYYGGRSEVRHRKDPILVTLIDATSMYPTVFELQGMDAFLKAEKITTVDNTAEVQAMLDGFTLADVINKDNWKKFPTICLLKPNEDVLPFRSRYGDKLKKKHPDAVRTIGIKHVRSVNGAGWWTLQDLIASKLLEGRAPRIERVITFVPEGVQDLQEIRIINDIVIKQTDRILKKIVEERQRIKKQIDAITDKERSEYKPLDQIQHGLKTIANSISYGIYLQLDKTPGKSAVDVYGFTQYKSRVDKVEKPGPMFNPLIGIFQTSGARLMLAAVEAWLNQHGGYYAGCDTDSMFVSPQHARPLQDFFQPLSPYDDPSIKMFKIEKEKQPDGTEVLLENVWYYGISAKRYALYLINASGEIIILKYSSHGLGQLRLDERAWWKDVIEVHYHPELLESKLDKYRFRVAAHQLTISNYDTWRLLDAYNEGKSVDQMVKPFGFVTVGPHRLRHPRTMEPIIPIVPYANPDNKDFEKIPYMPFFDKRTGDEYTNPPKEGKLATASYWNSFADVFKKFINHPEAKSEGDVGRLERRHMIMNVADVNHIGKESDEIEEAIALGDDPENVTEYAESDKNKVKIIATAPRKAVINHVPRSTFYYARKKTLEGMDYKPQKHTKKRIKGL